MNRTRIFDRTKAIFGLFGLVILFFIFVGVYWGYFRIQNLAEYGNSLHAVSEDLRATLDNEEYLNASLSAELASVSAALHALEQEDQRLINLALEKDIQEVKVVYTQSIDVYEDLVKLREQTAKTAAFDEAYVKAIGYLADMNYGSASASLERLERDIGIEREKIAASFQIPANVPVNSAPPNSGYSRQQVQADSGTYMVSMVAADLNSTRVIVDTASDGDCGNECPVLPLGTYVSRSGGFAGVNGSYFCPASYPSCAGKTNSFDTLVMNKNKTYFNSENNVYSTVPAVIFSGNSARYVGRSLEWGRDTGVDAVIANQPLLVSGGNVVFGGDGDPKKGSKSPRGFVASRGSMVYIGVVHSATVAESARTLKALGVEYGLNLDGGGSTALWSGGYKVGPGRNIPNAIVLVRK